MRNGFRTLIVLMTLTWLLPGLAEAQRKARLVGKVVDQDGKPLEGVTVTATSPQLPDFKEVRTTDRKGAFIIDFRHVDVTYQYRFEKPGYQVTEATQEWYLEGTQHFEWKMRRQISVPGGAALTVATSEEAALAYNSGVAALKAGNYVLAEAKFTDAVQHDPGLRQAWAALAAVQVELGHDRQAAESAERAIALGAMDEAVLLARWQAYTNLKDEARAAIALEDMQRIGRRLEEAKRVHNEAVALARGGDHAAAFARFQTALNLDPNLRESLLGLATAAHALGRHAEAAAAAEKVLTADPTNEKAARLRYNACLALDDKSRLAEALFGLAAYEPELARNGLLKVAFDAYDAHDTALAKNAFSKVIRLKPDYPQAHYFLGLIAIGEGNNGEAVTHLQRFLQLAPNDPEAASVREMLAHLAKS
jgi:tetratricopeptide (TPR) repeat protein